MHLGQAIFYEVYKVNQLILNYLDLLYKGHLLFLVRL